jgi:hypothetical protein
MSALDERANRSLGVVDCEDAFRRTIATFNGEDDTRLQTQTGPPDEDGKHDAGCGELVGSPVLGRQAYSR